MLYTILILFSESSNNNTPSTTSLNNQHNNTSTDFDVTLNDSIEFNLNDSETFNNHDFNTNINSSMFLIQSESTDTNNSQEEVDPKSQLANKTIFKTDNPNLSIIEISDNSSKENELENSVILIETSSDDENTYKNFAVQERMQQQQEKSPGRSPSETAASLAAPNVSTTPAIDSAASEKRRKKAETLIHSSKQKLNVAIAEASYAAGDSSKTEPNGNIKLTSNSIEQPETKREIKIYDSLNEFEKNLPSTVTILDTPFGSKVYLVGTAHFSEESQDDVSYVSTALSFKQKMNF